MNAHIEALIPILEAESLALGAQYDAACDAATSAAARRDALSDRLYFLNRLIEAAQNILNDERREVPL